MMVVDLLFSQVMGVQGHGVIITLVYLEIVNMEVLQALLILLFSHHFSQWISYQIMISPLFVLWVAVIIVNLMCHLGGQCWICLTHDRCGLLACPFLSVGAGG